MKSRPGVQKKAFKVIEDMINQGIIEEHPINELAPWISNAVITSKQDGLIRMTPDILNVIKDILLRIILLHVMRRLKPNCQNFKYFPKWNSIQTVWKLNLMKHVVTWLYSTITINFLDPKGWSWGQSHHEKN